MGVQEVKTGFKTMFETMFKTMFAVQLTVVSRSSEMRGAPGQPAIGDGDRWVGAGGPPGSGPRFFIFYFLYYFD